MNTQAQEKTGGNIAHIDPEKSAIHTFANRLGVEPNKVMATLKATAFKIKDREPTNEELMALLIVANEHKLNPFTKEIYAFLDKHKGVVPIVSVDGWARIINEHRELDGIEFRYADENVVMDGAKECPKWCECTIYRKDRAHPITIREYLDEVYRPAFKDKKTGYESAGPWQSHTKRFLRHKALIQASRIAFGFSGIYDEDEARRIVDGGMLREGPDGAFTPPPADAPPRPGAITNTNTDTPPEVFPLLDFNGEDLGEHQGHEWIDGWLTEFDGVSGLDEKKQFVDNNSDAWDDVRAAGFVTEDIALAVNGLRAEIAAAKRDAQQQDTTAADAQSDSQDPAVPFDDAMDPKDMAKALADRVRACETTDEIDAVKKANQTSLDWLKEHAPGQHDLVTGVLTNREKALAQ